MIINNGTIADCKFDSKLIKTNSAISQKYLVQNTVKKNT